MEAREHIWPGWETGKVLGRGNFSKVYEIRRENFGVEEKAALKVITIPQDPADIDELLTNGYDAKSVTARFRSHLEAIVGEYNLMARLKGHPNVVYCDDLRYIQHDDGIGWDVYIKMELLQPLSKALSGDIEPDHAIQVGRDICAALMVCRDSGILHRDIKPQNIFMGKDGSFKLGDFGVAKAVEKTTGGTKVGTYNYMAPEVYKGQPYGHRADIYSLGIVLYWMLNGRRLPFLPLPPQVPTVTQENEAREYRFRGDPLPPPAEGNQELKRIVLKACAYDPGERYASAEEMLRDLEAMSEHTEGMFQGWKDREAERLRKEREAREKREAERLRKEREAREKREAEERERLRRQKEEAERKRQEEERRRKEAKRKRCKLIVLLLSAAVAVLALGYFTIHFWSQGSCTEPQKCSLCGKERDEAAGHRWSAASCTEDQICLACGELGQSAAGHCWSAVSCTEDQVCLVCGELGQSAPGHNWSAKYCTEDQVCLVCGTIGQTASGHRWNINTCTEPRKCDVCGYVENSAPGHQWTLATQAAPQTCMVCGITEGRSLGTNLTDCTILRTSNELGDDIVIGTWVDIQNTVCVNSSRFWVKRLPGSSDCEDVTYALNGQYDVLTLFLSMSDDSDKDSQVRFWFYGDGALLYGSLWVDRQTGPCSIELNVREVSDLTIVCETISSVDTYGIVQGVLYIE